MSLCLSNFHHFFLTPRPSYQPSLVDSIQTKHNDWTKMLLWPLFSCSSLSAWPSSSVDQNYPRGMKCQGQRRTFWTLQPSVRCSTSSDAREHFWGTFFWHKENRSDERYHVDIDGGTHPAVAAMGSHNQYFQTIGHQDVKTHMTVLLLMMNEESFPSLIALEEFLCNSGIIQVKEENLLT